VDAERASGFRYGQRAYLIQLYRQDGGTWLVDPIALPDLSRLAAFLSPHEWILHAASQDLPCLAEVGLIPQRIFDTELAGRLLGRDRVGLAPLVAAELGWHLEKGHGAADWSTRPLPESWRRYAALDVEVLPALRDRLAQDLVNANKWSWAEEEFQAIVAAPPSAPRVDPWRRTSGMHKVRSRRSLAIVKNLWEARDELAQERDTAPGRVLPDAAIVTVALAVPDTQQALREVQGYKRGLAAQHLGRWWSAIHSALAMTEDELPELAIRGDGPPPPRNWASKNPAAAQRLHRAKQALVILSEKHCVPVENMASPEAIRRILWTPPTSADEEVVRYELQKLGLRSWQCELITPVICEVVQSA
jgi:ribonuclease D